jgi:hypothetical protein
MAPSDERSKIRSPDPDRVDHTDVCELASLAEPVDRRAADSQPPGDLRHAQEGPLPGP